MNQQPVVVSQAASKPTAVADAVYSEKFTHEMYEFESVDMDGDLNYRPPPDDRSFDLAVLREAVHLFRE